MKIFPALVEYMAKGNIYEIDVSEFLPPKQKDLSEQLSVVAEEDDNELQESKQIITDLIGELKELKEAYNDLKSKDKQQKELNKKGRRRYTFDLSVDSGSDSDILTSFGQSRFKKDREPTPSMLEYEEVTGVKERVLNVSEELKQATKYAKREPPEVCNGKDKK